MLNRQSRFEIIYPATKTSKPQNHISQHFSLLQIHNKTHYLQRLHLNQEHLLPFQDLRVDQNIQQPKQQNNQQMKPTLNLQTSQALTDGPEHPTTNNDNASIHTSVTADSLTSESDDDGIFCNYEK